MNFQLQSSPFKLQLSACQERCFLPRSPHEQQALMEVTFDVLCAAQHRVPELLGADLIILLKSNLEPGL